MLTIKVGNTYADYRDDVNIQVVKRSPLFAEGKGSFIFNFQLPATDALKKELDFYHRPGRYGDKHITRPVSVAFGPLKFEGTGEISEADEENYEIALPVENGDLNRLLKESTLRGLNLGGERTLTPTPERVNADTSEVILISSMDMEYSEWLNFTVINTNLDGELNTGNIITIGTTRRISLIFNFVYDWLRAATVELKVFVNGVEHSSRSVIKDQTNVQLGFTIDAVQGDEITFQMYLTGEHQLPPTTPPITFAIDTGAKIMLYNHLDLSAGLSRYPDSDFALFPIENSRMLENVPDDTYEVDHIAPKETYSKFFPVVNYYKDGEFPVMMSGTSEGQEFMAFNLIVPFPYLAYVVKAIKAKFEFSLDNNLFEEGDNRQLVIINTMAENNYINGDSIAIKETFDLKDHVPDVTISEYLAEVCKLLGIAYQYDNVYRELKLKYLRDIALDSATTVFPGIMTTKPRLLASPLNGYKFKLDNSGDEYATKKFKDLAGLDYKGELDYHYQLYGITAQELDDCWYVRDREEYYVFHYDPEQGKLDWVMHSRNYFDFYSDTDTTIGDTSLEISPKVSPVMMKSRLDTDPQLCSRQPLRYWLIPKTEQLGNFPGLPRDLRTPFKLNIALYLGLREDANQNLYPLGSNDILDLAGYQCSFPAPDGFIPGLSLRWDGVNGLYEKRYKEWIQLLVGSRGFFRMQAAMTALQLSQIDFFKWYSTGEFKFLIKDIKFNITRNGVSVAELDVLIK